MKIIKVVHSNNPSTLQVEKQALLLQSYDVDAFISKKEAKIIAEAKKILSSDLSRWKKAGDVASMARHGIYFPILCGSGGFLMSPDKMAEAVATSTSKQCVELFRSLAIKQTANTLVEDLLSSLETVEVISLGEARQVYSKTQNLSVGTYTLHPRDSSCLTRIEHYHKNLALEKDNELVVLLGRMGAKTLKISEIQARRREQEVEGKLASLSTSINSDIDLSKHLDKAKDLSAQFEGNKVDIDKDLLRDSLWFKDDSRLLSIFESRRFNSNRITEYTLRNTYTETFDFDFKLAAKHLIVNIDLKAEYQALSRVERLFHVEFG